MQVMNAFGNNVEFNPSAINASNVLDFIKLGQFYRTNPSFDFYLEHLFARFNELEICLTAAPFSDNSCTLGIRLISSRTIISFFNAQNRINYQNRIVLVEPSGNVTYHARFTATFQAPDFDFRHFPLDNQKFSIILDSVRPLKQVQFKELEGYSQMGETLGEEEWILGNAKVEITEHTELLKESSRFIFAFHGERHLNYYLVRILLPTIIIILVSWFTFFLKDYGKRIDLANGNLLLFIAFNFTIGNDLPRLGYLTLMDTFLISTFVITGLVALANVVLKRMERHGKTDMINRIDTIGIWGYPIFYFGARGLLFLIYHLSL